VQLIPPESTAGAPGVESVSQAGRDTGCERESLLGYTRSELRARFAEVGLQAYRADQVLRWIYARGVVDLGRMSDVGAKTRALLEDRFETRSLEVDRIASSTDGTRKLRLRTPDGAAIESVIIPDGRRRTVCISSQIGCSLECTFCATGRLGFGRNLRAHEILAQWIEAVALLSEIGERPTHIVFMGMGEPLLNLSNVIRSIRVLTDPQTGALSPRRITVSTSGIVPRIAELGAETRVRLAISLHATTDEIRNQLVPINRRFPLEMLLDACRAYPVARRDRISFEYILIRGVNDAPEDAERLCKLLRGLPAKVNLIPMNEHAGADYRRPDDACIERFAEQLARAHMAVSVRKSRGDDILAACGQLGALAPGTGAREG